MVKYIYHQKSHVPVPMIIRAKPHLNIQGLAYITIDRTIHAMYARHCRNLNYM